MRNKFKFTIEYQWDLLRYTVQDKNGYKALIKYQDYYFTLIEHQIIAHCLKQYYRKNKKLPSETFLREDIIKLLNSDKYKNLVDNDDKQEIINSINPLYHDVVKDGDLIYAYCKEFSAYVRLKDALDNVDIEDFNSYQQFSKQIQDSIIDEDELDKTEESFLLRDIRNRQFKRQEIKSIFPTPFRQVNSLTNAGGYEAGSIIVLLDKQKRGKTTALINVARGYLKMGKKVLYIDLENGKDNIFARLEQSIMNIDKDELLTGKLDNKIQKRFRKYRRLGGEIVVENLPALVTTTNDIQNIIDFYYRQYGIKFDVIIVDFMAKMGCLSRKDDERNRISDVYIEMDNLAKKNNIEHVWTANHVNREGAKKRMKTRYIGEDIALCIDIARHAQAIFGINRSPEEEEAGFFRFELVEQRDGVPQGRAVFNINMETQRVEELNINERKIYDEEFFPSISMEDDEGDVKYVKKKNSTDDFE